MPHDAALFQTILDNPEDDTARLVYADWLEEHGGQERAELIRVQIELARLLEDEPRLPWVQDHFTEDFPGEWPWLLKDDSRRWQLAERQRKLLAKFDKKLHRELPKIRGIRWGRLQRGFVNEIVVSGFGALCNHAETIFAAAPITQFNFEDFELEKPDVLAALPQLARIRKLECSGMRMEDRGWQMLESPHLTHLRTLDLGYSDGGTDLAAALAGAPAMANLQTVNLSHNEIDTESARRLLRSTHLKSLRSLNLTGNFQFDPKALFGEPRLAQLSRLSVSGCGLQVRGIADLAKSRHLKSLTHLELAYNEIGPQGVAALLAAPFLSRLIELNIGNNSLGNDGVRKLAKSPRVANLRVLVLEENQLGSDALTALANSPHLSNLGVLDLKDNHIGVRGAQALAKSPYLANLTVLDLFGNQLGDKGVAALANSPALANLNLLVLAANGITDKGAKALADSPYLERVTTLVMQGNEKVTKKGNDALRKRFKKHVQLAWQGRG